MKLAVDLSYRVFIMLRYIPYIPILVWVFFYHKWMLNAMIIWFLSFTLLIGYITHWFEDDESSFHPWNKYHLIIVYYLFDVLLNFVCYYSVEDFSIYVHWGYWTVIFFLYGILLTGFGNWILLASLKLVRKLSLLFNSMEELEKDRY